MSSKLLSLTVNWFVGLFVGLCFTCYFSLPALAKDTGDKPQLPQTQLPETQWDARPDGPLWTKYALQAITDHGPDLMRVEPRDIDKYCPAYERQDTEGRRAFWVYILSALAKFESNHDPAVKFDESKVDPTMVTRAGTPIISRGLLQISKESANGYGCAINDAQQLHDAKTNISCAVRIFNRWIGKDKIMSGRSSGKWTGIARYFSPFRNAAKRNSMGEASTDQPYCR